MHFLLSWKVVFHVLFCLEYAGICQSKMIHKGLPNEPDYSIILTEVHTNYDKIGKRKEVM